MANHPAANTTKVGLFLLGSILIFVAALQSRSAPVGAWANGKPMDKFIALNMKFEGMTTCNNASCHGGAALAKPLPGTECTFWQKSDHHAQAFETLKSAAALAYGKALGIANVAASEECLSCHAVNVPAALQGAGYDLKEGVTCAACHGPSEKWRGPHAAKVGGQPWAAVQRKAGPQAMLANFGFNDTKDLITRADNCTKCHLSIDASLVAAGHPQPAFEIDQYSLKQPKHWIDPTGYYPVKEWAVGQIVCLRDSMKQLADRAAGGKVDEPVKQAFAQAMSYGEMTLMIADAQGTPQAGLKTEQDQLKAAMAAATASDIQQHASAISTAANGMLAGIDKFDPDAKSTMQLVQAITSDNNFAKLYGRRGAEQQEYALWWLYVASYQPTQKVPTPDPVRLAIAPLFTIVKYDDRNAPLDDAATQKFIDGVAAVKTKLPPP
jgi:hypothetical protein